MELGWKLIVLNGNDDLSSFFFEYNFFYFMGKIWGIKEKVNFLIFNYVCIKWKDWVGFNIEFLIGIVKWSRIFLFNVYFYCLIEWKLIN